jgi:hypothetical protein
MFPELFRHKELAVGTLKSAIRQAGISVDEFVAAYKKSNRGELQKNPKKPLHQTSR